MKKNTTKTDDGTEIYENKILLLTDKYISDLSDENDIKTVGGFRGLLKYLYKNVFKRGHDNRSNCNIDYGNTDLLNDIWDSYTGLCYKYGHIPTLSNFSMLTGIAVDTFQSWKRGEYRPENSLAVKKWLSECESSAVDNVLKTGNPGSMFILKCCYQYTETPQQIIVSNGLNPAQTAAEIAARHTDGGLLPPELPENV